VTLYVYASVSGAGHGIVRCAFPGGNIDTGAITVLGWYSVADTAVVAAAGGWDYFSLQGYVTKAGTLTVWNAVLIETAEVS
jgi:hypothetical protein